jgi:FkbM family methyltransferase
MKRLITGATATVANFIITRLRNRVDLHLGREEFRFSQISFSLSGEDLAITRWLEWLPDVPKIYVDAGCFHPIYGSNTLLLYKRGWHGINIDMVPDKIALFDKYRPDDLNVVAALGSACTDVIMYEYEDSLTDRLLASSADSTTSLLGQCAKRSSPVSTTTIDHIIEASDWPIDQIGYLNIDCEGTDLDVLAGFDLDRYRPALITIEALPTKVALTLQRLSAAGYRHCETHDVTLLFVRMDLTFPAGFRWIE